MLLYGRLKAKCHYTGPTGPARTLSETRTDPTEFLGDLGRKKVRAGPVGFGWARVVAFSYKLTHVGFRAHVKIASRIVSYLNPFPRTSQTNGRRSTCIRECFARSPFVYRTICRTPSPRREPASDSTAGQWSGTVYS